MKTKAYMVLDIVTGPINADINYISHPVVNINGKPTVLPTLSFEGEPEAIIAEMTDIIRKTVTNAFEQHTRTLKEYLGRDQEPPLPGVNREGDIDCVCVANPDGGVFAVPLHPGDHIEYDDAGNPIMVLRTTDK